MNREEAIKHLEHDEDDWVVFMRHYQGKLTDEKYPEIRGQRQ